jgi:tripartite-type tricarboxylate transporter receptor subunit TctC
MMRKFMPAVAAACLLSSAVVHGQNYPTHGIRFVVPYPPGGTTDVLARLVAQKLSESWGQQVVVDNRVGGVAVIGTDIVAKAQPDGHTIGMFLTPHAVNPSIMKSLPYDTTKDFAPITLVAIVPGILSMNPAVPANDLRDIVALAKAKPKSLNYASPGPITSGHLSIELFKSMAGIDLTHIPYKGGAPAITALISGEVQLLVNGPPNVLPHIRAGRLKAMAVTTARRLPSVPNVPTIAEQGYPGYDTYEWYGIFAPGRTPRAVVDKLSQEVARLLKLPDVSERIATLGAEPQGNTPAEFARFVRDEMERWGTLANKIGLKPD